MVVRFGTDTLLDEVPRKPSCVFVAVSVLHLVDLGVEIARGKIINNEKDFVRDFLLRLDDAPLFRVQLIRHDSGKHTELHPLASTPALRQPQGTTHILCQLRLVFDKMRDDKHLLAHTRKLDKAGVKSPKRLYTKLVQRAPIWFGHRGNDIPHRNTEGDVVDEMVLDERAEQVSGDHKLAGWVLWIKLVLVEHGMQHPCEDLRVTRGIGRFGFLQDV